MISLKEYLVTEMGKYRLGRIPKSVAEKIYLNNMKSIKDYIISKLVRKLMKDKEHG